MVKNWNSAIISVFYWDIITLTVYLTENGHPNVRIGLRENSFEIFGIKNPIKNIMSYSLDLRR